MNEKLKDVLFKINFKKRFDNLFDKHSHKNLFKNANPSEVRKIIEKSGLKCVYHREGKFFKIDNDQNPISLNMSTDIGIVEFVLDAIINGEAVGGPFGYMASQLGPEEKIKKPRFSDYVELEEILVEGFGIYKDIKKGLLEFRYK
jgi:hypothetical protein